jgi:hypothetical protein
MLEEKRIIHFPSIYPLRGMVYFIRHPKIWRLAFGRILFMIALAIAAMILLLVFGLPGQADGLSGYIAKGWSWILSTCMTVLELGIVVPIISTVVLVRRIDVIFDPIWLKTIEETNEEKPAGNSTRPKSFLKSFVWVVARILLMVITFPLNIIPVLGTILYIYINGFCLAWMLHCRYFDLIGLSFSEGKLLCLQ